MLKMSFYKGTLDRDKLKEFINETEKPIVFTYGYAYKHPTIYKVPQTKESALKIVDDEGYLDATETEEHLHLNAFSSNDMW